MDLCRPGVRYPGSLESGGGLLGGGGDAIETLREVSVHS